MISYNEASGFRIDATIIAIGDANAKVAYVLLSYQLKLTKMLAKLSSLNDCAVPFLSRAAVNLRWYWYNWNTIIAMETPVTVEYKITVTLPYASLTKEFL